MEAFITSIFESRFEAASRLAEEKKSGGASNVTGNARKRRSGRQRARQSPHEDIRDRRHAIRKNTVNKKYSKRRIFRSTEDRTRCFQSRQAEESSTSPEKLLQSLPLPHDKKRNPAEAYTPQSRSKKQPARSNSARRKNQAHPSQAPQAAATSTSKQERRHHTGRSHTTAQSGEPKETSAPLGGQTQADEAGVRR